MFFFTRITALLVLLCAMLLVNAAPVPRHMRRAAAALASRDVDPAMQVAAGQVVTGDGTFYYTGLGACGRVNQDSDLIVAVSKYLYDNYPGATANPNENPICGKMITASYEGKSVTVEVVDRCASADPDCMLDHLDFSPAAFSQLADQSMGRINVQWQWA